MCQKGLDCQPGLRTRPTYQGGRQEEQVLYLYFDMNYTAMKAERGDSLPGSPHQDPDAD